MCDGNGGGGGIRGGRGGFTTMGVAMFAIPFIATSPPEVACRLVRNLPLPLFQKPYRTQHRGEDAQTQRTTRAHGKPVTGQQLHVKTGENTCNVHVSDGGAVIVN
jgi:hypothetical protein